MKTSSLSFGLACIFMMLPAYAQAAGSAGDATDVCQCYCQNVVTDSSGDIAIQIFYDFGLSDTDFNYPFTTVAECTARNNQSCQGYQESPSGAVSGSGKYYNCHKVGKPK
jgi:hypothetical protein